MQTKQEIEKEYRLDSNGIIRSPGKFEAEPWWVVALWDLVLDGCPDREDTAADETVYSSFALDDSPEGRELCETIGRAIPTKREYVTLYERSDGFVVHAFMSEHDLDTCGLVEITWDAPKEPALAYSRGYDHGNYGNAYESTDWESWSERNRYDDCSPDCREGMILGFFASYEIDEISDEFLGEEVAALRAKRGEES